MRPEDLERLSLRVISGQASPEELAQYSAMMERAQAPVQDLMNNMMQQMIGQLGHITLRWRERINPPPANGPASPFVERLADPTVEVEVQLPVMAAEQFPDVVVLTQRVLERVSSAGMEQSAPSEGLGSGSAQSAPDPVAPAGGGTTSFAWDHAAEPSPPLDRLVGGFVHHPGDPPVMHPASEKCKRCQGEDL